MSFHSQRMVEAKQGRGRGYGASVDRKVCCSQRKQGSSLVPSSSDEESQAARRYKSGQPVYVQVPSETFLDQILEGYKMITAEMNRSTGSSVVILDLLAGVQDAILLTKQAAWSQLFDDLVQLLKECLVFRSTFRGHLQGEHRKNSVMVIHEPSSSNEDNQTDRMVRTAYDILSSVLSLLSPKDAYQFFESLMKSSKSGLSFLSLFQNEEFRASYRDSIKMEDLLKLATSSIRKGKCALSFVEPKIVAFQSVSHASFSANSGRLLNEFLLFVVDTVDKPVTGLEKEKVLDSLLSALGSVPPLRIGNILFVRLVMLVHSSAKNQAIPSDVILSLMCQILVFDWDLQEFPPAFNKLDFQKFLVSHCLGIILEWQQNVDAPGNMETKTKAAEKAIRVLTSFAKHRFQPFQPISLGVLKVMEDSLTITARLAKSVPDVRKGLRPQSISSQLQALLGVAVEVYNFAKTLTQSIGYHMRESNLDKDYLEEFLKLRHKIFIHPIESVSLNNSDEVLCGVVDLCACMTDEMLEMTKEEIVVSYIVRILGWTDHESIAVRARVARCMALYLQFKSLVAHDSHFILDCLEVIDSVSNKGTGDLLCKLNFAWATANAADALAKYHVDSGSLSLNWKTYLKLYRIGMQAANDTQKVRHNGIRVLGSLVAWTPPNLLKSREAEVLGCVTETAAWLSTQVANGSEDYKARWNASHALANIIRKKELWDKFHLSLSEHIFPAFVRTLKTSQNYKEKLQCVRGIVSVKSKGEFSTYYKPIWIAMLSALNHEPETKTPTPHGQAEKYREEVGLGILYMCSIEPVMAACNLEDVFLGHYESVLQAVEISLARSPDAEDSEWLVTGRSNAVSIIRAVYKKDVDYPREDIEDRLQTIFNSFSSIH